MAGSNNKYSLSAGALRRRLTIQRSAQTDDGVLGVTNSWQDVATVWGAVSAKPSSTLLQLIAGQRMAQTVYDITIRYAPSLTIEPGMRVVDGSRILYIQNVNDLDERHRIVHLACVQQPAT